MDGWIWRETTSIPLQLFFPSIPFPIPHLFNIVKWHIEFYAADSSTVAVDPLKCISIFKYSTRMDFERKNCTITRHSKFSSAACTLKFNNNNLLISIFSSLIIFSIFFFLLFVYWNSILLVVRSLSWKWWWKLKNDDSKENKQYKKCTRIIEFSRHSQEHVVCKVFRENENENTLSFQSNL